MTTGRLQLCGFCSMLGRSIAVRPSMRLQLTLAAMVLQLLLQDIYTVKVVLLVELLMQLYLRR